MVWRISGGKVSDVESQWWESQWRRVCGGKVSDVESQWWESQWRGESGVGKSVMWKVNGGRVSGVEN